MMPLLCPQASRMLSTILKLGAAHRMVTKVHEFPDISPVILSRCNI
jgi:hypothetical protein